MSPKKKSRLIDGQRKLTSSLFSSGPRQLTETPGVEIEKQVEIDVDKGAKPSSSSNLVKTRSFLHTWTKTYSWLRYDQNDDFMFCEVCTDKKMFCNSFRFPDDDLLTSFGVLAMRPISFLPDEPALEEYGLKEIRSLCNYYGAPKTFKWMDSREAKQKTTKPLIDPEKTIEEWQLLKKVVVAEQYPREVMWQLWSLIATYHHDDFPNLITLARLGLMLAVHTAGCERGFSVKNNILTPSRNRLTPGVQQKLMRVKLGPDRGSFNFTAALKKWKQKKDHRVYELRALLT